MTNTENNTNHVLEQALYYLETLSWSVIPVGIDKKPLIDWKKYQSVKPTNEEVVAWFTKYPNANIAIPTGVLSNLTVVDIDPKNGGTDETFNKLVTVKSKTGSGGWHYFFKHENGVQNHAGIQPGIDIRGEGGYVIVPPSRNTAGTYEWLMSPQRGTLIIPLPDFVKQWIQNVKPKPNPNNSSFNLDVLNGVGAGNRNDSTASLAGKLLAHLPKVEWESVAWPLLKIWNLQNQPPLPENELLSVFNSIKKSEIESENETVREPSLGIKLLSSILQSNLVFFHDQYREGYVSLTGDGQEVLKLRSRPFRQWLCRYAWEEFGKIPQSDAIAGVIQTLEGKSLFDGEQHELYVRVTQKDNVIWYDLGNGPTIRIDNSGWALVENPPILFRRFNHQLKQVAPAPRGDLQKLTEFVNLQSEGDKLLFLIYTVATFIPNFPHPLLVFYGPQGAGKTTPLRVLKSLVDPSILKTQTAPDSLREFVQSASHHYFLFLDNISSIPDWLSDCLARAVTGDGFSKRELFSDDDDIIYAFQRAIGLNGINLVVQKADLLDRSVLLGLERIAKDKRKEETEFWKEFDGYKPTFLGAIFTAVSRALNEYPKINLSIHPRMADFTRWGCAIARALGFKDSEFLNAYYQNINQQNTAAIDASLVGTALISFMSYHESWEGTASELLEELEKQAEMLKINIKRSRDWPKDPSHLSRKLQLINSNLVEQGIKFTRNEKSRPRRVLIQKLPESVDTGVGADAESNNNTNPPTTTMSPKASDVSNADNIIAPSNEPATQMTLPTANPPKSSKDIFSLSMAEAKQQLKGVDWEIYINHFWKKIKEEKLPPPGQ